MDFIDAIPFWILAALVFGLRIADVTLGTVRIISAVHGHTTAAACLGFFEILIWVAAVSQVIIKINEYPFLMLAYAGGFAAGNAVGIALERRLAMGSSVLTFISSTGKGDQIAGALRARGQRVTTVAAEGRDGPRQIAYAMCRRRDARELVAAVQAVDPGAIHTTQSCSETSAALGLACARGRGPRKAK